MAFGLCFLLIAVSMIFLNENAILVLNVFNSAQSGLSIPLIFSKGWLETVLITLVILVSIVISFFHSQSPDSAPGNINSIHCFVLALLIGLILSGNTLTIFIFSFLGGLAASSFLSSERKRLNHLKLLQYH